MKVLITAGPTREPIDPVRFLSNRSSGRMGYALAGAFANDGHEVLLISGPTAIDIPDHVDYLPVQTAADMHQAVGQHIGRMNIAIFAAAVADYTAANIANQKIKKDTGKLSLELVSTTDILGSVRNEMNFRGTLVGFAAETEKLEEHARAKLLRKGCDLIIANDVSKPGIGFDSERNELLLVHPDHSEPLPQASKLDLAQQLVPTILELHQRKQH